MERRPAHRVVHARHAALVSLLIVANPSQLRGVQAMSCFSEMNFGWCEFSQVSPHDPPSCVHNYTFSIAGFQRKLDSHYNLRWRPPLMEAFFVSRLHPDYYKNLIDLDCPNPLIFANLLVGEFLLIAPPWGQPEEGLQHFEKALKLAKEASPFQQHLMVAKPAAWPFRKAMDQFQRTQSVAEEAFANVQAGYAPRVDFVIAHCKENLAWLSSKLGNVPPRSSLYIYEKCGQQTEVYLLEGIAKFAQTSVLQRPDIGQARGDECSAYLTHIVQKYDSLADVTIFLQSDPHEHLHFEYLDVVLRSIAAGTFAVPYLPLNGPRHVRTLTPCLSAVHEELFGTNLTDLLGPYCCAQFAVMKTSVLKRKLKFYRQMLSLVDGSKTADLCGVEGTKRSTQCYGFEFLWHVVFGEEVDPPAREDDHRLPVALRGKHGKEHARRNWVGVALARDIPLKYVPDHEEGNPLA